MVSKGLIFDIKRFSVNDGPGIRTTVFFKGCPLTCWWCHNPESRSCDAEQITIARKLNGREFLKQETIGKLFTVEEVMIEILKDAIFYETSGGGVTFSGGEPLLQPEFLKELSRECRLRSIHTCLDTSGYCDPSLFNELIPVFDLFLFDLKILNRDKHIQYTGYPNDEILVNLQQLDKSGIAYIIRVPVIPGVNDDRDSTDSLKGYLKSLINPMKEIHFLPYHALAGNKLKKLGMEDKMDKSIRVNESELHKLALEFEHSGYKVKIGG
jgi:pyruvate formate lyase activating enzyme